MSLGLAHAGEAFRRSSVSMGIGRAQVAARVPLALVNSNVTGRNSVVMCCCCWSPFTSRAQFLTLH
jgi:hypothetical protein